MGTSINTIEFKKKVIDLLREDEEFRLAIAGLLGLDNILLELKKLREDFLLFIKEQERRWEENNKRWEENNKRWEENNKKWEEAYKRFEAIENELRRLREDFNRFQVHVERRLDSFERRLVALGRRWGIETEEAFREGMKGVIEEVFGVGEVMRWVYYDDKGEVLGHPSHIEVDLLIKDRTHILVEVKASASDSDISKLWRVGKLYERVSGIKPRLVVVTPFIDDEGLKTAKELGVEVYTKT